MEHSLANIDFGAVGVVVAIAAFVGTILYQEQKRREDLLRGKLDELMSLLSVAERIVLSAEFGDDEERILHEMGLEPQEERIKRDMAENYGESILRFKKASSYFGSVRMIVVSYFPALEDDIAEIFEPIYEVIVKMKAMRFSECSVCTSSYFASMRALRSKIIRDQAILTRATFIPSEF